MVSEIFSVISDAVTNLASTLGSAITGITALFWQAPAQGETGVGSPTFLGILLLIAVGCGLVYFAYRVIKGAMTHVA